MNEWLGFLSEDLEYLSVVHSLIVVVRASPTPQDTIASLMLCMVKGTRLAEERVTRGVEISALQFWYL